MFWGVMLLIVALLCAWAESLTGKIALAGTVVALGSLIMSWLSEDEELWLDIAKWCGIAIVAVIALKLLALIFDA